MHYSLFTILNPSKPFHILKRVGSINNDRRAGNGPGLLIEDRQQGSGDYQVIMD